MAAAVSLRDLVIVCGHAPFGAGTVAVPADPGRDEGWVLQSFQRGEPPQYVEHIRRGVELARGNGEALLVFSGGFTRAEAGARWSEAATYRAIAAHFGWWTAPGERAGLAARAVEEDFSRDSFENLLFSLGRFQQVTGGYPRRVTVVSWGFKAGRFDRHRAAVGFPAERFDFVGSGEPAGLAAALAGEAAAARAWAEDRYGSTGALARKRAERNPLGRAHPFATCPGLGEFFAFMANPGNAAREYGGPLPWREGG